MRIHSSIGRDIVQIAGHKEHPQVGFDDRKMLRQLAAIHARHNHVGQQQIHMASVLSSRETGLDPVPGFEDLIANFGELIADKLTDAVIVLDEENRFRSLSEPLLMIPRYSPSWFVELTRGKYRSKVVPCPT